MRTRDGNGGGGRGRLTVIWALLLCAAAACNPFATQQGLRPMTVEPDGGVLIVLRDNDRVEVSGPFTLEPGDVIATRDAGARLHLEGDRFALVAPGSTIEIVNGATLENSKGAVLTESSQRMTVVFDEVESVIQDGNLRVERDVASASAATLAGSARVEAPGQQAVAVKRLFEVSVAAGEILEPRPYRVDERDAWDRRYLEGVVELDLQLQRYAQALRAQTSGKRPRTSFFGRAGVGFMRPYIERRTPMADLIIGFTIARVDDASSLGQSFRRAFDYRDQGAQWGVVAALMDVEAKPLLASLERLGSSVLAAMQGGASGVVFEDPDGDGTNAGTGTSPGAGGNVGRGDSGSGEGEGGDGGGDGEPPGSDCDNIIDCTLQNPPLPSPDTSESTLP